MPCSTSKKNLEKNLKNSLIEKSKEFGFDVIKITKPNISKENKDYFDMCWTNWLNASPYDCPKRAS